MLKNRIPRGIIIAVLLAVSAPLAAEQRAVFVNTARVLEEAPHARLARERLQQEFSPRDAELAVARKSLQALEERLEREGAVMSENERRTLEREVLTHQRELKRAQTEFSEDLNLRRNEEFARLQRLVSEAIAELARERGYDLVLEAGVVYASESVDVTQAVLERLRSKSQKENN